MTAHEAQLESRLAAAEQDLAGLEERVKEDLAQELQEKQKSLKSGRLVIFANERPSYAALIRHMTKEELARL